MAIRKTSTTRRVSKPYGKFSVYALIDPDTHRVFYVGRSKDASTRVMQHMREAENGQIDPDHVFKAVWGFIAGEETKSTYKKPPNPKKSSWLNDITLRRKDPVVKILDEWECVSLKDANRLEEAWIAEMRRRGEPLTNVILSHRMNPSWYSKSQKGWRPGWATNPIEYIKLLKDGKVGEASNRIKTSDDVMNSVLELEPSSAVAPKPSSSRASKKWDSRSWTKDTNVISNSGNNAKRPSAAKKRMDRALIMQKNRKI